MPEKPRKTIVLGIRMTPEAVDKLRQAAAEDRRQMSVLAGIILDDWIEARERAKAAAA